MHPLYSFTTPQLMTVDKITLSYPTLTPACKTPIPRYYPLLTPHILPLRNSPLTHQMLQAYTSYTPPLLPHGLRTRCGQATHKRWPTKPTKGRHIHLRCYHCTAPCDQRCHSHKCSTPGKMGHLAAQGLYAATQLPIHTQAVIVLPAAEGASLTSTPPTTHATAMP